MVRGGPTYGKRTGYYVVSGGAMKGVRCRSKVLEPIVVWDAKKAGEIFIFMNDNARLHRARVVTQFLENYGIQRIKWQSKSPDSNPIKKVWDMMGRSIGELEAKP